MSNDKPILSRRISQEEPKTEPRTDTVKSPERKSKRNRSSWGPMLQLAVPQAVLDKHPGMSFQWFNDEKGMIQQAESNDWERVPEMDNKPVGIGHTTNSMDAVLMMIPTEWKLEDEKYIEEQSLKHEDSLRRGLSMSEGGAVKSEAGLYAANTGDGERGYSRTTRTLSED
jgi:hypothetical protein